MLLQKLYLFNFLLTTAVVLSIPLMENVQTNFKNQVHRKQVPTTTTTTTESSVFHNLWNKISIFFRSEAQTSAPPKNRRWEQDEMEGYIPPPQTRKGNLNHDIRNMWQGMVPIDKKGDDDIREPLDDYSRFAGNFRQPNTGEQNSYDSDFPNIRPAFQRRKAVNSPPYFRPPNFQPQFPEANNLKSDDDNLQINPAAPIIEDFDQGDDDPFRMKRYPDFSNVKWQTEKVVAGSDPVENMDIENFKDEIEKDPFLFHKPQMKPIEIDRLDQYEM